MGPISRLSKTLADARDEITGTTFDVVIVGSGYGGGVSASRLARAGLKVAVLERGREVVTGEFPARFPEMRNEMRVTGKKMRLGSETGLYDVRLGDDMHVLVGCGLGGGSLVNAGVALRPDPRVFDDPVWPGQITQDGLLDKGYTLARQWLKPARDAAAFTRTKVKALAKAAETIGRQPVAPEVVVSFDDTVSAGGLAQPACTGCGDCCGGCNVGAKNTVALTYLPDAVRHGARLYTHARVTHVAPGTERRWTVHVTPVTEKRQSGDQQPVAIAADHVILAAGTLGSTEILLRSREQGLRLSDTLGQRFSANGDIIAFGYDAKVPVEAVGVGHPVKDGLKPVGAAVSAQVEIDDAHTLANQLCVQEGVMPSSLAPVLPVMFVPNGRLLGALKSLISGVYSGPLSRLQTFFAVSHDSAAGRFELDGGQLTLKWPKAADEPVYKRMDQVLDALVTNVGGAYVKNPLAGSVMGHQPATAHPLGGCAMSRDAGTGVVDHKCRVFKGDTTGTGDATAVHDGLYVIDGAIIPRSLGVNPLLTITALAERAMLHFLADRGLTIDHAPRTNAEPVPVTEPGRVAASP